MPDPSPAQPAPPPPTPPPSGDMSPYIRTFAKDVARLTNQPMPQAAAKLDAVAGVSLPDVDLSPVNRPDGIVKEFPREVLDVTKEATDDVFAKRPPGMPVSVPVGPTETERREEVLARLRAKVAAGPQPSADVPQPFVPPPPPAPPPIPPIGAPLDEASPLHTYSSDFADRIDRERASTFSVLAAQQDQGVTYTPPRRTSKRRQILSTIFALVLITLGAGGLYAGYVYLNQETSQEETLGVPSLIFADEKTELVGPDYLQALADAAGEPLVDGNILVTYVAEASTTPLGLRKAPQPGGILIRLLDLGAPDILMRNVDLTSTVGVVAAGGQTRPFFILRVNSYERTFAGMLGWEPRIMDDLALLYPPYAETPVPAASAATTTPVVAPVAAPSPPTEFVDAVVANRDVRRLVDRFGRTLLLYGYSDKQTLIIARDEAAFTTLVARLSATRGE